MEPFVGELRSLRRAVESFLGGDDLARNDVLRAVLALNNSLGPLLRRTDDPSLRELQLRINGVVVAAKSSDRRRLEEAMKEVETAASSVSWPPETD